MITDIRPQPVKFVRLTHAALKIDIYVNPAYVITVRAANGIGNTPTCTVSMVADGDDSNEFTVLGTAADVIAMLEGTPRPVAVPA